MIVTVRCFSCGAVLADKWLYYERECKKLELADGQDAVTKKDDKDEKDKVTKEEMKNMDKRSTGHILDDLGITRQCCRRMMLSTVDMMELI